MKSETKKNLSERELDLMEVLWEFGTATVAEVQKKLEEGPKKLAYTTIQTMLNRLETKKMVARDTSERVHRYRALLKQPSAVDNALKSLVQRFFGGSEEALMSRLVEKNLTAQDVDSIQSLIDEYRRKEPQK